MRATLLLLATIGAEACQRERTFKSHSHNLVRRQSSNETFPPELDANEQILVDSFDSTSISTWSYYYSMSKTASIDTILMNDSSWSPRCWYKQVYGTVDR